MSSFRGAAPIFSARIAYRDGTLYCDAGQPIAHEVRVCKGGDCNRMETTVQQETNALGRLVMARLEEKGLSYGDVARLGGLPKSTVYKLATTERWTNAPQVETLDRLARGLGLPPNVVRKAASEAVGLTQVVEEDPSLGILIGSIESLTAAEREQIAALVDAMTRGRA